jgi:cation transport regulator ChaC
VAARLWYFAYGSNVDRETFVGRRRMRPSEVRRARLDGFELVFDLPVGPGERAVANVRECAAAHIHGLAWRISERQARHLDRTEGVHIEGGYRRRTVEVVVDTGQRLEAFTYHSESSVPGRKPSRRYLNLLLRGARHHLLPPEWIDHLRSLELAVDERQDQPELPL